MSDQYNENEYDQRAKQSGQDFRNQAIKNGYKYINSHSGNAATSAGNAANSAGSIASSAGGSTASAGAATATAAEATGAGATAAGTGATVGTAAAAGAPTGGIGTLVVLAMSALKAGSDKVKAEGADIGQVTDVYKESKMSFFVFCAIGVLIIVCCLILLIPSCAMFFPKLMERGNTTETQQEASTSSIPSLIFNAHSDKNEFFRQVLGVDSYNIATNNIVQEYRQIDNTNIEIYKSIIDHAIWNAFNKHALSYCTDYDLLSMLDFIADKDMSFEDKIGYILFFDEEAALENYSSKKYPYTATHEDGDYYTIGDYLDGKIPDEELNNLINYAEIITVLSQSENCSANKFSYSTFYDMLTSKEAEMLLFEIKFDKERTWSKEVVEKAPAGEGDFENTPDTDDLIEDNPDQEDKEKQTDSDKKEETDNSESLNNKEDNITIEAVTTDKNKPNSDAPTSPVKPSEQNKDKRNDKEKDKNTSDNSSPSKTKPVDSSKNKNNSKKSSSAAIASNLQADIIPLKCMAFSHKMFRVVLPPAEIIGGSPTPSPTPVPRPTPAPTPEPDKEEPPADDDESLAEEIIESLIYKYGFYYDCEIAPYGLLELYTIAETDPDDMNANEYTMRNIDVLDISEKWLRAKISDISLGTDIRSPMQYLNSDIVSKGIAGLFSNDIYYKHAVNLRDQLSCDYIPDGQSVILDMYGYINQGKYPDNYRGTDGRGQSIKAAGCCDCAYTMIAMYLNRANYDIVNVSRNYVSNNNFRGRDFLNSVGLKEDIRDSAYSASSVIGYLTEGLPVMLHISGKWVYNGVTYHATTNGHFLIIMGFDDVGFYVYDPGSNKNTTSGPIPYAAFSHVAGKSIRVISRKSTFIPHYLINTYLK